ncbi:hypothetical protein KKB44_00510 [Candidatus Micrarchaeota archaeon]|nr:hypothetical protein [Candidatus Micrarchaeota archaeon]
MPKKKKAETKKKEPKSKQAELKEKLEKPKLVEPPEAPTQPKIEKPEPTKGNWFNTIFCFIAFFVVLFFELGFIYEYVTNMWKPEITSYVAVILLSLYTVFFLVTLAFGFAFNVISKFVGTLEKHSLLFKIDKKLDSLLWWLIPVFALLGLLLNVIVVECFYYTCI